MINSFFKFSILFLFTISTFSCGETPNKTITKTESKPKISFTFDDGITYNIVNYKFEDWNAMILNSLEEANVKAMFFVTGFNKLDKKGQYLLNSWNSKGHLIANHTFSHPNFNDKNNTVEMFEEELVRTDSIISKFENHVNLFRFPYLKEGNSKEKIDDIRNVLAKHHYKNGYVTIDASDWYVNSRLINQIKNKGEENVAMEDFKNFYLDHLIERATFYDSLSFQMNKRHIAHTILLHHNLTSALFLDDLIQRFQAEGWEIIDAEQAYKDSIFDEIPQVVPAGESLIWSLAKASGEHEKILRYPAEDSRYEKAKMDALGL